MMAGRVFIQLESSLSFTGNSELRSSTKTMELMAPSKDFLIFFFVIYSHLAIFIVTMKFLDLDNNMLRCILFVLYFIPL